MEVAAETEIRVFIDMPMLVIEEVREMSETVNVAVNNNWVRSAGDNDAQTRGVEVLVAEPLGDEGGGGSSWGCGRRGKRW